MLGQRILTAVLLLAVLLPALFYASHVPFCALTIGFIGAAAWEWARLATYGPAQAVVAGIAAALACAAAWALGLLEAPLPWLWAGTALVWVAGGAWLLRGGSRAWLALPRPVRLGGGLLLLVVAWLALAQARVVGINFLLSVLLLVWVADIGAYFAGRTFGGRIVKRKLAPSISPGKTWEGVWGGMLGVIVLALAWHAADKALQPAAFSLYTQVLRYGPVAMVLVALFLAGMSVVGDLVESLMKRTAGVKDSSALLPGHGGVLDRIDALLPTLPLAMLFLTL